MLMSKTLIKKGLNTDIINHIYSFLTFKDEFDEVIQQLNEAGISNAMRWDAFWNQVIIYASSTVWRRCNKTNTYQRLFVWWPPTSKTFGSTGYVVVKELNKSI